MLQLFHLFTNVLDGQTFYWGDIHVYWVLLLYENTLQNIKTTQQYWRNTKTIFCSQYPTNVLLFTWTCKQNGIRGHFFCYFLLFNRRPSATYSIVTELTLSFSFCSVYSYMAPYSLKVRTDVLIKGIYWVFLFFENTQQDTKTTQNYLRNE